VNLSGFAFVDTTLDRAAHLREAEADLDALWSQARVLRLDGESRALEGPAFDQWPEGASVAEARPPDACFLGLVEGRACFVLERPAEGQRGTDLRRAGMQWPAREASVFATAAGLLNWRRRARFCGACGGEVADRQGGWSVRCTRCGLEAYPRTDPAIIVAVTSGDRLLLGRQRSWPPGRWSVVAGFVEPGESLAQAVVREVAEETGVTVVAVHYVDAQPWPFPSALMLGFVAEAAPEAPDPVVGEELEAAAWFDREAVRAGLAASDLPPSEPPAPLAFAPRLSIARALIEAWVAGRLPGAAG
jgi:NAD+ diphosphatase